MVLLCFGNNVYFDICSSGRIGIYLLSILGITVIFKFVGGFLLFVLLIYAIDGAFRFFRYPQINVWTAAHRTKMVWLQEKVKQPPEQFDLVFVGSSRFQLG